MKIGVFDSGVGGQNVVRAIEQAFDEVEVIFKDDRAHLPYGNKSPEEILTFMTPIMHSFEHESVDAIVIACNTASTNVLQELKQLVHVPVVGFVPMIKPARAITNTGNIVVCATPGTLRSKRYAELKAEFGNGITIYEPDCSQWASMVERDELHEEQLEEVVESAKASSADVIVLGCTHYHWIEEELRSLCGQDIQVIQPTEAVIAELKRVVGQ